MLMALTEAATAVSVDVVRAIDGDTLVVTVDDSLRKLRRLGIDAPEYDQDGGMAAVVRDWRTVC
jgi:endonuclease YncB( thermonuclease family)